MGHNDGGKLLRCRQPTQKAQHLNLIADIDVRRGLVE